MKILSNSIRDISDQFVELEKLLDDANYVVTIYSKTFKYVADVTPFNINNLREIFFESKDTIRGNFTLIDWVEAHKKIITHLSYATYFHNDHSDVLSGFKIVNQIERQKRINLFENIIRQHISIPPAKIIEHLPSRPSYFGDFLMWGLCFIFLNDSDGIVVYFETSD